MRPRSPNVVAATCHPPVTAGARGRGHNERVAANQVITVRGIVRTPDISTANSVASSQIADMEIRVNGKGVVADAVRRPNALYRLLLGLLPF